MKGKSTLLLKSKILILAVSVLLSCQKDKSKTKDLDPTFSEDTVISINHVEVSKEEYILHLKREVALTYNYFYQKHGIENSPTFWETPINGNKPIDYLKEKTDKKLTGSKITHQLAERYKVIEGFKFEDFKKHWRDYNKTRKEKYNKGEVVYGTVYTDLASYYNYLLSNLKLRLRKNIIKSEFNPNENTLRNYYEHIKKKHFSFHDRIETDVVGFQYKIVSYQEANKKINEIKKELDKGTILGKHLIKKFPKSQYQKMIYYDSIPIYGEDNPNQILKENALQLELNEYRIVKAQEGTYIIKLISRSEEKHDPFNDVKDQVLQIYQDERYTNFMDSIVDITKIIKNRPVYDNISAKDFR